MSLMNLLDEVNDLVQAQIDRMEEVLPEDLGLDRRAGYRLYVDSTTIAISKQDDRSLQYYGGFEYVDKDARHELGDWVFYTDEDNRVQRHLDRYFEKEDEEDDISPEGLVND